MELPEVFTNLPNIETERILMRAIELDDAPDVFQFAKDPDVLKYSIGDYHQSEEESERFIQSIHHAYENNLAGIWGITIKPDPTVVGTCGFELWFPDHYRAEIGYSLVKRLWHKGYGTEAVKAMIEFGFTSELKLNRIEATCQEGNIYSSRILEKMGMKREGLLRKHTYSRGVFNDVYMYSLLKSEYLGK